MPRVVPSQVVELIDSMFPWAAHERQEYLPQTLGIRDAAKLAALVSIVEEVPSNLITLDAAHYTNLVCSVAAIKNALNLWPHQGGSYVFDRVPGLSDLNPVTLIRQALSLCPDEYPSPATAELTFVEDAELRTNLRTDISVANEALSNGQWKAATVLAGATLEALLLWALDKHPERSKAVEALLASNALAEKPNSDPKRWSLHDYIEVASKLSLVSEDAAKEARLAKDFRNLIHPGKEQRLRQVCDRGTARVALAAVDHVVRDLEQRRR